MLCLNIESKKYKNKFLIHKLSKLFYGFSSLTKSVKNTKKDKPNGLMFEIKKYQIKNGQTKVMEIFFLKE